MSWITIRTGVATLMDTVTGVSQHARAALKKSDSITATVVYGEPVLQPGGHNSLWTVRFAIRVKCAKATLEDAQDALDALIWPTGAGSLIAALESDDTLGGAVHDMRVEDVVFVEQSADSTEVVADIRVMAMVTA